MEACQPRRRPGRLAVGAAARRARLTRPLIVLLWLALAGCTGDGSGAAPNEQPDPTLATTAPTTAPARLAPVAPYKPLEGEPAPELKVLASNALQSVGTYDAGDGTAESALARIPPDVDAGLVESASQLLVGDAASSIEIIYPQLGGLTDDAASVMVVYRWQKIIDGRKSEETRTADVRLQRTPAGWRATSVATLGGDAPASSSPALTPSASAVLDNDQIDLADSARWDIQAGRIGDPVLDALLALAQNHALSITVLATGHPREVFETPR